MPTLEQSATLTPPRMEMVVSLPEGRKVGIAEFGPVGGRPILWFHGTPGGRNQIPEPLRASLEDRDVRLIVVERPGYGDSTRYLHPTVKAFGSDVERILDALGIDRFGVAALSGGGPYALGVGHTFADRVVAVSVLGGVVPRVGPEALPGGVIAALKPIVPIARVLNGPVGVALGWTIKLTSPFGESAFDVVTQKLPLFAPGDKEVFSQPDMQAMFMGDMVQTAQNGLSGPVLDLVLFSKHWGFELSDVTVPVHFWQGDSDPMVTLEQGTKMAEAVPGSNLVVREGESHLGGFATAVDAVDAILGHWPNRARAARAAAGR